MKSSEALPQILRAPTEIGWWTFFSVLASFLLLLWNDDETTETMLLVEIISILFLIFSPSFYGIFSAKCLNALLL